MSKLHRCTLFIFRRDLRLDDNVGLNAALQRSEKVIPCFIVDPRQVGSANTYYSAYAAQFMAESLQDLEQQFEKNGGKLYVFCGKAEEVVGTILSANKAIDAVFVNCDYTPFSVKRDTAIEKVCKKTGVAFEGFHDALLTVPGQIVAGSNEPYKVFTPFFRAASQIPIKKPRKISSLGAWYTKKLSGTLGRGYVKKIVQKTSSSLNVSGGTVEAQKILKNIKQFKAYEETHNFPLLPTTFLSAHLKFGTISIRSVYHAIKDSLGRAHPLIRQLYWRDFFTHVASYYPHVFGHAYRKKYDALQWSSSKKLFKAWCEGKTGFPIVDAGMRQLNETGFMHNRVRMIVGSFLVKDLHIDWRWGEKYFAQKLVDYDPAVNNGNWQWVASTGCDAQPYFRIFNPWLQQKKFDADCEYIKLWIPELELIDSRVIHTWYKDIHEPIKDYPKPLIDHGIESKKTKELFKKV